MLSQASSTRRDRAAAERPAHLSHERQRSLVLASLLIHPGTPDSTHRRWAEDRRGGIR